MNRREFLSGAIGVAAARAQQQAPVSSTPSPRDYMRQDPIQYPDPDIIALDNRFRRYIVGNTVDPATSLSARCGRKARHGTASADISCGATFRTTSRCAGSKTTGA